MEKVKNNNSLEKLHTQKISNFLKKYQDIIILSIIILISYGNIKIFRIRYSTADDYLLNNIISGTFGDNYDYHLLYINNILGIILKILYSIIPKINLYAFYLIFTLSVCFMIIIKRANKNFILFSLILILYIITLYNLTYTIIAYLSVGVGVIDLIFKRQETTHNYLSYLLIINGYLLRSQVLYPILAVLGVILIIKLIQEKDKKTTINLFILFILLIALNIVGTLFYKQNNILKNFQQWQEASIKIRDYTPIDYYKYKNIFEEINWNENDLKLFYTWNFADNDKFSVENMNKIVNNVQISDRYNLNLKSVISNFIKQYFTKKITLNETYILLFVILFITCMIKYKGKKSAKYIYIYSFKHHCNSYNVNYSK